MSAKSKPSSHSESQPNVATTARRTLLDVWEDWLYGYDFFVSYRWEDGRKYAVALTDELRKNFSVFLDSKEYAIGDSLSGQGNRAVRKASRLVLVATPGVAHSEHVKREISVFRETKRRLLVIDFKGSFERLRSIDAQMHELLSPDELRVVEHVEVNNAPSSDVLESIRASLATETKRSKRRKAIVSALASIAILALFATFSCLVAYRFYQYKVAQHYLAQILHAKVKDSDQGLLKVIVEDQPIVDVAKLVTMCGRLGTVVHLEVSNSELTGTDSLAQLDHLSFLSLYQSKGIDSLAFTKRLSKLRELRLYGTEISDEHLETFGKTGELEVLSLSKNSRVSEKHIARILRENPNLETLRLYGCENFQLSLDLVTEIKKRADFLKKKRKKLTIDIGKTAIKLSQDYEAVKKVLQSLLKDGHQIEGTEEDPEPPGGFSSVYPHSRNVDSRRWFLIGICSKSNVRESD